MRKLAYPQSHIDSSKRLIRSWNAIYKPGDTVDLKNIDGGRTSCQLSGKAFLLGGHTAYVALRGVKAPVPLRDILQGV